MNPALGIEPDAHSSFALLQLKCCGVDDPKEWVTMGNRTEIPASCYEDDQLPSSANSTAGLRTEVVSLGSAATACLT